MPIDPNDCVMGRISRASTIPSRWYVDGEIYRLELAKIFPHVWQPVGRVDQLSKPGAYFTCEIAGEPLVVVRGPDDVIRAFSNVCRHRGGAVAQGEGVASVFHCFYHGWIYNLDGTLRSAREMGVVEDFDKSQIALPTVRVEVISPFVFVALSAEAPALHSVLGEFPNQLARCSSGHPHLMATRSYEIASNWKLIMDNFLECYHCPLIHRKTVATKVNLTNYIVEARDWYSLHYMESAPLGDVEEHEKSRANGSGERIEPGPDVRSTFAFFPNFAVNLLPGWVVTFLVIPHGVENSTVVRDFYRFDTEDARANGNMDVIRYYEEVFLEDTKIVELVQKNLKSRWYSTGRYSARHEVGVHHFHSMLKQHLNVRN